MFNTEIAYLLVLCLSQATAFHISQDSFQYVYDPSRPKIAAHRGLASLFPENTMESFSGAMYEGTDFIELDVVLNKDSELIVTHDAYMSRATNIEELEQFADRKRKRMLEYEKDSELVQEERDDWWVMDFTLDELRTIKMKQNLIEGRTKILDGLFTFPTLEEVIRNVIAFNQQYQGKRNNDGNLVGILLEIKDGPFHRREFGVQIAGLVVDLIKQMNLNTVQSSAEQVPIVFMSFDPDSVRLCHEYSPLPRVQLVKEQWMPLSLEEMAQYATILGPDVNQLWSYENQTATDLYYQIRETEMLIYAWTFRDDDKAMVLFKAENSQQLYEKAMTQFRLDGIITEFAGIAAQYAQVYRN